jgi:hypothetical protein
MDLDGRDVRLSGGRELDREEEIGGRGGREGDLGRHRWVCEPWGRLY